jgi:hypothetical protein
MLLTMFHLGECHRFPSKWPTFGEGLQLGVPGGVIDHSRPYIPLSTHYIPIILSSSRPLTLVTYEGHIPHFMGRRG